MNTPRSKLRVLKQSAHPAVPGVALCEAWEPVEDTMLNVKFLSKFFGTKKTCIIKGFFTKKHSMNCMN